MKFIAASHIICVILRIIEENEALMYTCYVIPKTHSGESDDHKVGGFQQRPFFHLLEDQCGHKDEEYASQQDGQHSGDDPNNSWTHFPLLSALEHLKM